MARRCWVELAHGHPPQWPVGRVEIDVDRIESVWLTDDSDNVGAKILWITMQAGDRWRCLESARGEIDRARTMEST